jgi:hypothetical protein
MLTQLLGRQGFCAQVIPHAAVRAGAAVAALNTAGVRMICLTYAGIAGTSSHLRYTVRRIRARAPTAVILVGFWPADLADDDRMRAAVGADAYAASLRETVAACMAQACGSTDGSAD